jgi:hypothetical protein
VNVSPIRAIWVGISRRVHAAAPPYTHLNHKIFCLSSVDLPIVPLSRSLFPALDEGLDADAD